MSKLLTVLGTLCKKSYRYPDERYTPSHYIKFFIYQKLLRINSRVPWPVHFTSYVTGHENISFGSKCSPGSSLHQYIQGINGIKMGNNVLMAPGVTIISANHDMTEFDKHVKAEPITIGDNVWIGANAIILPGVKIGSNTVIGAGSVVTKDIPNNSIAAGVPCKVIRKNQTKKLDVSL